MASLISDQTVVYRWPHLNALPECELAGQALQVMDVEARCFLGWAPVALALVVEQLRIRPGARMQFESRDGGLRVRTSGGTGIYKGQSDYISRVNASRLANSFCELCGRPGRPLQVYTLMSVCDADWHLYRTYRTAHGVGISELSFPPRLPILASAAAARAAAEVELGAELDNVPAGWTEPALRALVHLAGVRAGRVTFRTAITHLEAISPSGDRRVQAIAGALAQQTAATCRDCGRRVHAKTEHPGRCDGCDMLQQRGWHIDFPDLVAENTSNRKDVMDVPAFLAALPIGSVFTHANPNEQPDSWVKVDELYYRRTYGWPKFTAKDFAHWAHAELTTPVDYSISQAEADRRAADARRRPHTGEMGG